MLRSLFALSLIISLSVSAIGQDEFAAPLGKLELNAGDSIVFLGDSITHQCLYTQYVEDYFYTRMPGVRLKIHNAGVGGARAIDALDRFSDDVASYEPKYITILLGMNDGSYTPYNEEIFQTYMKDMTTLLEKIEGIGAQPIPMTPTMFDARAARMKANPRRPRTPEMLALYNSVLTYYGTWLRDVAQVNGLGFVDMWGPLNNITFEERKKDPKFTMIEDAIHPGPNGQVVMATAMINDLGLPRQVSSIRVYKDPKGEWAQRCSGGELTDLAETDSGITFTWTAQSLPWVLPEEAQLGAKLTKLGHKLSREAVEIHGLKPGRYELLIDGMSVGVYASDMLARHIELQENAKTPQYQQALAVANTNKERNDKAVRPLRGEWSKFQRYARDRRSAEQAPDNADLQKQAEATAKAIEGMDERVAEHNKLAQEYEDKIFELNQPLARKYELKRVTGKPAAN